MDRQGNAKRRKYIKGGNHQIKIVCFNDGYAFAGQRVDQSPLVLVVRERGQFLNIKDKTNYMRFILFIILMGLLAKVCGGQIRNSIPEKEITGRKVTGIFKDYKREILPLSLVFLAGAADGLNQSITYQYNNFKKVFPNANDQFWSPQLSFTNKYKNHDPLQGAAFPGSKGPFVFLTDGYHLTRFGERLFLAGALSLKITGRKQKWYFYVLQGMIYWVTNRAGFCLIYNQFN